MLAQEVDEDDQPRHEDERARGDHRDGCIQPEGEEEAERHQQGNVVATRELFEVGDHNGGESRDQGGDGGDNGALQ